MNWPIKYLKVRERLVASLSLAIWDSVAASGFRIWNRVNLTYQKFFLLWLNFLGNLILLQNEEPKSDGGRVSLRCDDREKEQMVPVRLVRLVPQIFCEPNRTLRSFFVIFFFFFFYKKKKRVIFFSSSLGVQFYECPQKNPQ